MTKEVVEKISNKYNKQIGENSEEIIKGINLREGHCPCIIISNKDTKCPCKTFRITKECHCGLFV